MKAVGVMKHGDLEAIEDLYIPVPLPKDDEVLIKVHWGGVNFIDTYERAGLYPAKVFPMVLGAELSGEIVKLPTSPTVLSDPEYRIRGLTVGDYVCACQPGAFAEFVCVPWSQVSKLPPTLDVQMGAVILLQGLSSLTFATAGCNVKKGDVVLVYSSAGGVGISLVQIAADRGATVIATVSSEKKVEVAKWAGAHHVLVTSEQNVVDEVLRITDGKGCDGIFDGIGAETYEDNFKMIGRGGTIVSMGKASGRPPAVDEARLAERDIKFIRSNLYKDIARPEDQRVYSARLFDLVARKVVVPKVYNEYPFSAEGVRRSQEDISSRGTIGKLLIRVKP